MRGNKTKPASSGKPAIIYEVAGMLLLAHTGYVIHTHNLWFAPHLTNPSFGYLAILALGFIGVILLLRSAKSQ